MSSCSWIQGKLSDYNTIISDPQTICYIAEFMHQTGLLSQFREADLREPAKPD
ncbi:uncharacterized protein ACLA_056130 [Aspergillus clavatus NRRL 1]|uniref:Uncharacterized protein n=1 Tax=Aspergillus clavatus (strain ATCC 1007 / CBS 513.65 / DSM 816 / NCTC 3887 / NRRL 1 / QM 1276 / 107) TaxID=344612 RepID=A1C9P0_ASPCL|nr:uncharacterized protein ACLA_056130 [Aspergillus clavatus NRRL 1]EAW13564.1 hypothetical protein ACLA_056130 [Aspergillus clavatus NRRL 1]